LQREHASDSVAASGAEVKREVPDRAIDPSAELGVAFVDESRRRCADHRMPLAARRARTYADARDRSTYALQAPGPYRSIGS
jgi:hypothetical protein